jgi:hypothetical protein
LVQDGEENVRLHEALSQLGVRELRSFADAWGVEVIRKDDRAEYIENLLQMRHELLDEAHVSARVHFDDLPYPVHMMVRLVLREMLNEPGFVASVDTFHENLLAQEHELFAWSADGRALLHLDKRTVEIYKDVLSAAWEDGNVDASEYHLIERLRQKLGITRRDHRVMEIQSGHFPSKSGQVHTVDEIEGAATHLLKHGLMVRPRMDDGSRAYCIPEEIGGVLRDIYRIELIAPNYHSLLEQLPVSAIRTALQQHGQPSTGTREFLMARLIDGYVSPRVVLRELTDEQLDTLLKALPGIRQDGSHEIRVRNVVKYYDRLTIVAKPTGEPDNRLTSYVAYYTDLARRAYDVLRATNVISKDKEIERGFEQATSILFQDYFRLPVETMSGSNHPDGRVDIRDGTRVILWDCKSCEGPYNLTDVHSRQFLAYAAAAHPRVASPLLVIAPAFTDESAHVAHKLKTACPPGTEIALVAAEDLLWLAEWWRAHADRPLPWQVLAVTGRLTRPLIEDRLKTFASAA